MTSLDLLFPGDNETSALARSLDWAATPLGAPESWPVSLRVAAGIVNGAGFPTILLWGPQLTQIYNDGYRAVMRVKHPSGMGQPTHECWPEARDLTEPIYERVRQGETLAFDNYLFPLARYGRIEDAFFKLSFSPVRNEAFEVAGVIVTLFETTEQINAEGKLRESEERLTFALEAGGGVGAWNWDVQKDRFYADARFAELFSVDPSKAAAGAPLADFVDGIYPDDREWVAERVAQVVADAGDYLAEYRVRHADGSIHWICARGRCYHDAHGVPTRFPGVVVDITDLKLAEAERRRIANQLQMVIDNVPGFVSYIDQDYRYTFANAPYQNWFKKAVVGSHIRDVIGPKYFEMLRGHLERAFAGEVVSFQQSSLVKDSAVQHVRITYTPDHDEAGNVRGVVAMIQDITAATDLERHLRSSEERIQLIFAQAPIGVAVMRGRDLVFELANDAYRQFLPERELLGQPLLEVVPEVNPKIREILNGILDTGVPFVGEEYLIPLDRNRDGILEDVWFTFVYQPLLDPDGSVVGIVVIAVDVSTHVRAKQELKHANRELEAFAYLASHDIQEPMRMVSIFTQLILDRINDDSPEIRGYAGYVRQGIDRMQALIRDLLTYTHTAYKDESAVIGTADLSTSLSEATAILHSRIEESGAVIRASALPKVRGATAQLTHVFQNLLSNALKYRKEGKPPRIDIAAVKDGIQWTIAVKDNGIGFAQEYADQIFGLFKRLHKDEYPGTGLGLAICQRIVERYGGRMWAEGAVDEGATFFFALPEAEE